MRSILIDWILSNRTLSLIYLISWIIVLAEGGFIAWRHRRMLPQGLGYFGLGVLLNVINLVVSIVVRNTYPVHTWSMGLAKTWQVLSVLMIAALAIQTSLGVRRIDEVYRRAEESDEE